MKPHIPGLMGLRTALMLACGLALGGLASPAAAKTIVVTTLTDTADPSDGLAGQGMPTLPFRGDCLRWLSV